MRYRLITFLIFGAALIGLGEWDARNHRFEFTTGVNQWWLDFCVGNSRDRIGDPKVTFVAIDEEYETVMPSEELTRLDYAVILGNLEKFKPASVAIVPALAWEEDNLLHEGALKEQVLKMPRLALGAVVENGGPPEEGASEDPFPVLSNVTGDPLTVQPFTRSVAFPAAELRVNGVPAVSWVELSETAEDPRPKVPLIVRRGDTLIASLTLQAIIGYADVGLDAVEVVLHPATARPHVRVGDEYEIPIDDDGRMSLYTHSGITPRDYPRVHAANLPLAGADDPEIAALRTQFDDDFDAIADTLVVLGFDREQDRIHTLGEADRHSIAELLARAIATVQSGRYIERWPLWAKISGVVMIVLMALLVFRQPRRKVILWGLVLTFLYFGGSLLVFKSSLLWTEPFVPLALFALAIVIGLILPGGEAKQGTALVDADPTEDVSTGKVTDAAEAS